MNNKHKRRDKMPRGLWVGKILKPQRLWANPQIPERFDNWYFRIRKVGLPLQNRAMPDYIQTEAQAREYARLQFQAAELRATEELRTAVDHARARRTREVTVGQYIAAFQQVAAARKLKKFHRSVTSLRRVIAVARGFIRPRVVRINRHASHIADKVDALPLVDAVNEKTVIEYARLTQGGEHINLDRNNPPVINSTINSTLGNARGCFSKQARTFQVGELNVPWHKIESFMRIVMPKPRKDVAEDIPTTDAFCKMMDAWRLLSVSENDDDRELALVNELFRLLGLRSGELVMARESWLFQMQDGRSCLWVKNYPAEGWSCKSANQAKLPLTDDLAARLRARCEAARAAGIQNPHLILPLIPGETPDPVSGHAPESRDRIRMVRERHNKWLKGFISEVHSRQGNHRLRKYCATRIYAEEMAAHHNEAKAATRVKEYLRHSKEATALLHYIAKNDERLATVTDATLMPAVVAATA